MKAVDKLIQRQKLTKEEFIEILKQQHKWKKIKVYY